MRVKGETLASPTATRGEISELRKDIEREKQGIKGAKSGLVDAMRKKEIGESAATTIKSTTSLNTIKNVNAKAESEVYEDIPNDCALSPRTLAKSHSKFSFKDEHVRDFISNDEYSVEDDKEAHELLSSYLSIDTSDDESGGLRRDRYRLMIWLEISSPSTGEELESIESKQVDSSIDNENDDVLQTIKDWQINSEHSNDDEERDDVTTGVVTVYQKPQEDKRDNTIIKTLSALADESTCLTRSLSKTCPICKSYLLHNYKPEPIPSCSLMLPLQELYELMSPRTGDRIRAIAEEAKTKTNEEAKDENVPLYCTSCNVLVVDQENTEAILAKEMQLAQLTTTYAEEKRRHEEKCKQLHDEKANLDEYHNKRMIEVEQRIAQVYCDKSSVEDNMIEMEGQHNNLIVKMGAQCEELKDLHDNRMNALETKIHQGEQLRRMMHNRIQELRGNIRVFVRTRPFITSEDGAVESSDTTIKVSHDGETVSIMGPRKNSQEFKFDTAFAPLATQADVFEEVSDFVQSALDGYNVCLFSYGQTGSGKTHTMQGYGTSEERGIIPRASEKILLQTKEMVAQNWKYQMSASYLEIYNNELKDLLKSMQADEVLSITSPPSGDRRKNSDKLEIKKKKGENVYVEGLIRVKIDTSDTESGLRKLQTIMKVAEKARSVAATNMHSKSSRSHAVFIIHLLGYNEKTGAVVKGSLNLCDLAGSERLDRTGTVADAVRLRETLSINKSLSSLGNVFNALASGNKHVPYRDSKLTHLLQDCLSDNGKSLMLVNLSPTGENMKESLCSLRFAKRVSQVIFGKLKKQVGHNDRIPRIKERRSP